MTTMQTKFAEPHAVQEPDCAALAGKLRAAFVGVPVDNISLHDATSDLVWHSAGMMGPDEHGAARHACQIFLSEDDTNVCPMDLGEGQAAVGLAARTDGHLSAMALLVGDQRLYQRSLTLARETLPDSLVATLAALATAFAPASSQASTPARQRSGVRSIARKGHRASADRVASAEELDRLNGVLLSAPITLYAQQLTPLQDVSSPTQYEVLLRSGRAETTDVAPIDMLDMASRHGLGSLIDRRVLTELLPWVIAFLREHPENQWLFSVNLTSTALRDVHFLRFVELMLSKSKIPPGALGFELDAPVCRELGAGASQLARTLSNLGCPVTLDNFSLHRDDMDLLYLVGVRQLKFTPDLTARLATDSGAQTAVSGLVQMSRVLGLQTVAKHADLSQRQLLTELGVDFAQSREFAPPLPLCEIA